MVTYDNCFLVGEAGADWDLKCTKARSALLRPDFFLVIFSSTFSPPPFFLKKKIEVEAHPTLLYKCPHAAPFAVLFSAIAVTAAVVAAAAFCFVGYLAWEREEDLQP